ncbi:hypothetical [Yersinia pestis KIM10+]|uniref:Uncharacterized protein n=1 Tax=Yersinia pestis TaxID=632 RepID=Q8CK93_YERPE|nr:hypothetical [Yersinia pestis KIM10+]
MLLAKGGIAASVGVGEIGGALISCGGAVFFTPLAS